MGTFVFWTERDWSRKTCYGNTIKGVILFLLWCTFMVPSFKNTALIFLEILFIQYFTIFSCKQYDVITDLICIIEKSLSLKWKEIFQKEKRHSSVFWKAFQISGKYFSCHRHFNPALKETNLDVGQAFIDPWEMQSSLGHPKTDLQIKAKNGTQSFDLEFHTWYWQAYVWLYFF